MIRPDQIVTAVGGRVMEGSGVEYLQNGRIGRDNLPTFTRASRAWTRQQRDRWVQVSSQQARYRVVRLGGEYQLGLTLESSGANALRFSSVLSSTAATSTGAPVWVGASSLSSADAITSTGLVSMIEGQNAWRFRSGGGSSEHGLYQDITAPSTRWVTMSAVAEQDDSTGFAMRLEGSTTGVAVMDGSLSWDGTFSVTLSSGAAAGFPAYSHVEPLGLGPQNGRAYRVTMGARLPTPGQNLRASLFPVGVASSTRATYLHHAQLTAQAARQEVMVRATTAPELRAAEVMTLPAVNLPGGPASLYHESVFYDRRGTAGEPAASTDADAVFLALARGWESTAGPLVGGGVYNREGAIVVAGSTGAAVSPGDRLEQCVSISSAGQLTYQVRVNGGRVQTTRSTGVLLPSSPPRQPSYAFQNDQLLLLNVLARGVHDLDDFRALFR